MSAAKPFIFPTYQSNLQSAIRDVVVRINEGQTWEAWEALQTLYALCPPNVEQECQETFNKIHEHLNAIVGHKTIDIAFTHAGHKAAIFRILYLNNRELLRVIKKHLFEKGYLERKIGQVPSNIPPGWDGQETESM